MTYPIFTELPLTAITPTGWLKEQLCLQADGLTGHLEEIWPDVGPTSGWLGGQGEDWERGPYYVDGLIPLAYILRDERLIGKANKWIESIITSQRSDGFFGPATNNDWWPRMVALKALIQHHDATGDARALDLMRKYFRHQHENLTRRPLESWGRARAAENVLSVLWLYQHSREEWLLELADLLFTQSLDWETYLTRDLVRGPAEKFDHFTHVVNVAMAIKFSAMHALRDGNPEHLKTVLTSIANLDRYHGMVHGMFSGDEWLAGTEPQHGVELCAVVELMFSLEQLIRVFGEASFADRLEQIAYNALAAHCGSDMRTHQYHQQVNQISCTIAQRAWTFSSDDTNTFGLEPHFGCCTANLHQGWPKFVRSLWMQASDGLVASAYPPNQMTATVNGTSVTIDTTTDYPFNEGLRFEVSPDCPVEFSLYLRIPEWCSSPRLIVNGQEQQVRRNDRGFASLKREWQTSDKVSLNLPMTVRAFDRPKGAVSFAVGPLVLVHWPGEVWEKIPGSQHFGDWEVRRRYSWNYGVVVDAKRTLEIKRSKIGSPPFALGKRRPDRIVEGSPLTATIGGKHLPEWKEVSNSAGAVPESPVKCQLPLQEIDLVPYGCARIRIAEFPRVAADA